MKFCIISGQKGEDVKQYFIKEAQRFFDTVTSVPLDKVVFDCRHGETVPLYRNGDLRDYDAVYVRAFNDDFLAAEILLDALERSDVYMPISLDGYQITNHKFYSVERIARIGVPVPDSSLTVTPESSLEINKRIGFPIVLKLLRGFGGKGVMLLRSEAELKPVLDTLQVFNEFPTGQRYIQNKGADLRALVIGDEVFGIRRESKGEEWRANVSGGGSAKRVDLSEDIQEMSRKVAQLLGMEICAVDFVESHDATYFIEANFSPGIMTPYFGTEIVKKIMAYIASRTRELS